MNNRDALPRSAAELAATVRGGHRSTRAGVDRALAAIAAGNRRIQAVDVVLEQQARREADALDDQFREARAGGREPDAEAFPLAGVPVAVKADHDVAGLVTTHGGRANTRPATRDAEVVRRLRAAGAAVVATTHMPELALYPFTEGAAWGVTRNPWDVSRSVGGSSGGSAAAVAAGFVPLALGSDGGGSIRVPASCCGLVGLKPARGRVPATSEPDMWGVLGTVGPLARTVRDSALAFDVVADPVRPSAPSGAPATDGAPSGRALAAADRDPGHLRIGWIRRTPWPIVRVDPRVARVVAEVAAALQAAGHQVEELTARWPDSQPAFVPLFYDAARRGAAAVDHPDRMEARTHATVRAGAWVRPGVRAAALRFVERFTRRVEAEYAHVDLLLTPTMACLPPRLGQLDGAGLTRAMHRSLPVVAFTTLANVTGHPAISVPGGMVDGLPVGVQFYAPGGDEGILLSLAAQLERLRPWPLLAPSLPLGQPGA